MRVKRRHGIAALAVVLLACGAGRDASATARVELRVARRDDPPAPIQALAIDDDGTVQARSLHLPRGEPVRLEVRAMTPVVLTVEGTDTELLVHPGTTFLHVRVAGSAATALIASPHARVVAGRTDVMPAIALSTDEVQALVAYIECLARPCESLSCAAVCDDDPATLVSRGSLGPHGSVSGCDLELSYW